MNIKKSSVYSKAQNLKILVDYSATECGVFNGGDVDIYQIDKNTLEISGGYSLPDSEKDPWEDDYINYIIFNIIINKNLDGLLAAKLTVEEIIGEEVEIYFLPRLIYDCYNAIGAYSPARTDINRLISELKTKKEIILYNKE